MADRTSAPDTFTAVLEAVEAFADLRASETDLDRLGSDPRLVEIIEAVVTRWNASATSVLPLRHDPHWSQLSAETLAIMICGGDAVLTGLRTYLPESSVPARSPQQRLALYLALLHQRLADRQIESAPWIHLAAIVRTLCAPAMHETLARCRRHVGVGYGLAGYLWKREDAEDELGELITELQWLSVKHLAPKDRGMGREQPGIFPELSSALAQTLHQKISDPVAGLVAALNGRLNILPRAVAEQMRKDEQPLRRHHRYHVVDVDHQYSKRVRKREDDAASQLEDLPDTQQLNPLETLLEEEELTARDQRLIRLMMETQRLRAESGKYRVGYEALMKEHSIETLAKENKTTPRTIMRWRENFLAELARRGKSSPRRRS